MALNNRARAFPSADVYRSASSSEEDAQFTELSAHPNPLSPPRPFFFARNRNSWGTTTSTDASDSDRERDPQTPAAPPVPKVIKTRHGGRQPKKASSTLDFHSHSPVTGEPGTPRLASDPFKDGSGFIRRPPPSSFNFPFQAYPGNPDPLPRFRRASMESFHLRERPGSANSNHDVNANGYQGVSRGMPPTNPDFEPEFARPNAPFMAPGSNGTPSPTPSMTNIYRGSAAAALSTLPTHSSSPDLPRTASSFRAPFLSPASRPSSIWQPPIYSVYGNNNYGQANSSNPSLPPLKKSKPPLPSTKLTSKLTQEEKPWINEKEDRIRLSWWLTILMWLLGAFGGAVLCYIGWTDVKLLNDSQLCEVFSDDFNSFDSNIWTKDVELGGFGNGEFQMTTDSDTNLYTSNGQLYIYPTLTSDEIGTQAVLNGGNYTLQGCTTQNSSACTASSSSDRKVVINPVQSARISTQQSYSIKYGKVEVVAKLPRGDWLWPAIWMLPVSTDAYGPWPASGEIDIMEARGNLPSYAGQGTNYVRSSLNYGPFQTIMAKLYGWQSEKRSSFDQSFHTYTLEWTDGWMRVSVDSRIKATLDMTVSGKGGTSFWNRGNFPQTAQNGSAEVVVQQLYTSPSAPFDQNFYLILDLAVGGTSGWFPDSVGNKPWYDGSSTAMYDFANAQDTWAATWPSNADDRAFRIDSVKMWSMC